MTEMKHNMATGEAEGRIHLAAAFRWAARMNWHEAVSNHFSLAVSDDGRRFLTNPNASHFSLVRASDLVLMDLDDPDTMNRPDAPHAAAWSLHGAIHRAFPHARCALHVHSPFATVLACLEDPRLPPIDQNTAAFWNRVAIDPEYGGLALGDEAERAVRNLADPTRKVLLMAQHGVMVVGQSVADALNRLYFFERSAETYIRALSTGRPMKVMTPEVAEHTARQWEVDEAGLDENHFAAILRLLDRDREDFRD